VFRVWYRATTPPLERVDNDLIPFELAPTSVSAVSLGIDGRGGDLRPRHIPIRGNIAEPPFWAELGSVARKNKDVMASAVRWVRRRIFSCLTSQAPTRRPGAPDALKRAVNTLRKVVEEPDPSSAARDMGAKASACTKRLFFAERFHDLGPVLN
jgi:hypothetical protein